MAIAGELVVSVETEGRRVRAARARVDRPRVARRLFAGRRAGEAALLAGTLFAICGRSQAVAAAAAVEAARGHAPSPEMRRARDAQVAAETVQEHAWRLLVDWPKLAGREPQVQPLSAGRKILSTLLAGNVAAEGKQAREQARQWAGQAIYGMPPPDFLALSSARELERWTREAGTPVSALAMQILAERAGLGATDVDLLPESGDDWLRGEVASALADDDAFEERPHRRGKAWETGPLARVASHPLVASAVADWGRGVGARLVARLVELAACLADAGGRQGAVALARDAGIAWVETPRGLLVHSVRLAGEQIADYRIVAPTEWNFHPSGAFSRAAVGLAADDAARLEQDVRWLVASLDPCVGVRYEAVHA